MTNPIRFAALFAASLALFACSPQQAAEAAPAEASAKVHPVSGLEVVPLTVTSGSKVHRFRVEVAASGAEQRQGLMFRTELGPDEGMIFPYAAPQQLSFWMKNTPLPLDIIFIADGRILNIAAQTEPYSLDSVASVGMGDLVLEIPGGRAAELGIKPGDTVDY
ncbi:DUF192 domain-containing protein [Parerythrobacter lacustris]|uniref:DUF192 domain-containing protein n=1 Tax=Parerythrobacter lacustris TaxID=2969984 RepID=A0ABT1XUF7_9SPHN|nr:DUF192 domain-containing protein [Parerythrobacter lacustris]MCR2835251.1 DUF192 domain-containing protein [Parerythrobacter lacustris]